MEYLASDTNSPSSVPPPGEHAFPLAVSFHFTPGGGEYQAANAATGAADSQAATTSSEYSLATLPTPPTELLQQAVAADDRLRKYTLLQGAPEDSAYFVPSLSVLSEAAFGRLTGIAPNHVKEWADNLVLAYTEEDDSQMITKPSSEQDIWQPHTLVRNVTDSSSTNAPSLATKLKNLQAVAERRQQDQMTDASQTTSVRKRPCGYVFRRGDIAWNCRTCQTDPTCVICDDCFRQSDHTGHEVYFHRTTPGGCCDCGDLEAWKIDGCCDLHRPDDTQGVVAPSTDDPMEAVRMARQGLQDETALVTIPPTALTPKTTAALATVIGAAVQCIVQATNGAGIGADPSQFKHQWPLEAAMVANGKVTPYGCLDNDLDDASQRHSGARNFQKNPSHYASEVLPVGYRLSLRLHNDDVHTFDEVIEAMHESRRRNPVGGPANVEPLVTRREQATSLTQHVDSDGQVTVLMYDRVSDAIQGFRRLKSRGLHCAVVSAPQVQQELRARALVSWLADLSTAHPVASALLVQALVQVQGSANEQLFAGITPVWKEARSIPLWASTDKREDKATACRRRFLAFPPYWSSSFLTKLESSDLYRVTRSVVPPSQLAEITGSLPLPGDCMRRTHGLPAPERYFKSPHALWGTLPAQYMTENSVIGKHPFLVQLVGDHSQSVIDPKSTHALTESVYVVDTDLRKQQEADRITCSVYPHKLPGLYLLSGVATVPLDSLDKQGRPKQEMDDEMDQPLPQQETYLPNAMEYRHLLATSSFRAPLSPILLLLLLDPYPTKQLRGALHALFLSLLTDARFRCRFAGALGIAYRPLSTLFCAGVGTEADTPLHFAVQILTAGSLVRALGCAPAISKLLLPDQDDEVEERNTSATIGIFCSPIAHTIVRCIHTNLLGATKEVNMILNNTYSDNDEESGDAPTTGNDGLLPALTYVAGEHPLMTLLPAAPDDGFLDSRSTRHKRLPHLLRDLEYVMETPGTALRLLLPQHFPVYEGPQLSFRGEDTLTFSVVFGRMLRLAQGMDPQKRKISGGHVEYEQNRWLEAFGLSLNLAGARDALAESPTPIDGLALYKEGIGNFIAAILREIKVWLYREGMLETGLPVPSGAHGLELTRIETLQRSTLHVSGVSDSEDGAKDDTVAISCATGVKMPEHQLSLIESALKAEGAERLLRSTELGRGNKYVFSGGTVMGDWLRVPHSPLAGDSLSFHLPLHRALAKTVKSSCAVVVTDEDKNANPSWWKIPVLDEDRNTTNADPSAMATHPLLPLIWPTLRSSNCRVVWSAGPDCSPQEAHRRRSRSRNVSANIAVAKVVHSLADHPIRCIAAAQQIERHLWARNGSSVAGMAINYTSTGLCRSFRDLDLLMVQLSASGMSAGLGSRRIFSLLLSRFSMDGYLCDPERRASTSAGTPGQYAPSSIMWVHPPRLQDPDHAVVLAESFFSTLCVVVTELPPPPPASTTDSAPLQQTIRRELLHALACEPRSRSEAMNAAAIAASRRDDGAAGLGEGSGGSMFRDVFAVVLNEIAKQKNAGSARAASGPPAFELKPEFCDEYDPTFYHLRRQDHQHAMDVIARLRKQKWGSDKEAVEARCLPVVCSPPKAHPRFMACRLLLHLPALDASVRRTLLFALTGGSWLPPSEPRPTVVDISETKSPRGSISDAGSVFSDLGELPHVTTFTRRLMHRASSGSSTFKRSNSDSDGPPPFSKEVVAASAVSFLEVLQLLTLQVHTLEECAALHRALPDLDEESRQLSAGLSINSYISRLVAVPGSLVDAWALQPHPHGPLDSRGSGENRGSILGLLIALYEHRADHGAVDDSDDGNGESDHGGARALASSGLKWLLRFVHALVDGAPSVAAAAKSATSGISFQQRTPKSPIISDSASATWTINDEVRKTAKHMLNGLRDLWPVKRSNTLTTVETSATKSKEAGKAAQKKMLERMKMMQNKFATSIGPSDDPSEKAVEEECIICRCDDADGENNGPLGYLGHVQRSRVIPMRCIQEQSQDALGKNPLVDCYRVVGHKGCQLREEEAMDSKALECLPRGSIVTVLERKFSHEYDILSRRVKVRLESKQGDEVKVTEGWASVQSSQGYIILQPLVALCYSNTRWGVTRPIIKQCGHAAHLKCVETHTLSLHQRAAGEQPYDGRFAANINDGEFLCPLCKQLSNILIPRDTLASREDKNSSSTAPTFPLERQDRLRKLLCSSRLVKKKNDTANDMCWLALENFGSNMYQAMSVTWDRTTRKKQQQQWHPCIRKWDYDEDEATSDSKMKGILRAMREQLISWSAIGHTAAAAEAGSRGIEEVLPFGTVSQTSDPWSGFNKKSQFDHPMLLELKRTLIGSSGLLEVLCSKLVNQLAGRDGSPSDDPVVGACLADAISGNSWALGLARPDGRVDELLLWNELISVTASTPCHVARDGELAQKYEARSAASAMWASNGLGASPSSPGEPPAPFALKRLLQRAGINDATFQEGWGSSVPFVSSKGLPEIPEPFRPAVASAYLYTPLLGWDLLTFSSAVFSSLLVNEVGLLPTCEDLIQLSRSLVTARIIQSIITPHGVHLPDEMDLHSDENCWSPDEMAVQAQALSRLFSHCRTMVKERKIDAQSGLVGSIEGLAPNSVLEGVGAAVLPFTRALILLLRATRASIRDRLLGAGASDDRLNSFDALDKILCEPNLMEIEDGFAFVKALGGPYPSSFIEGSGDWLPLINRWLVSVVAYDSHSGPDGPNLASTLLPHLVEKSLTIDASSTSSSKRAADRDPKGIKNAHQEVVDEGMASDGGDEAVGSDDRPAVIELLNDAALAAVGDVVDTDMDDAEEMIDFGEQLLGAPVPLYDIVDDQVESSDDSVYDDAAESDREFSHLSTSPVLLYQPSLLGRQAMGLSRHGTILADLSHLGVAHRKEAPTFSLIRLPNSFVELYGIVNKVKGREDAAGEDNEESSGSETAICLLTGSVLRSGSSRRSSYNRALRPPGACTLHARKNGSGIGIFFLVQKCTVLLMHNNKSAYSPSLYVDEHGEEDPGLRRGRPLFLNSSRYRALELIWRQQKVPWEVAQIRSTSDRVIRDNWY